MKNTFLKVCYIANLFLILIALLLPITYFLKVNFISDLLVSDIWGFIRGVLLILTIILWIYCINIWAKFDKKLYRLFLILLLNSIYIIFYYRKALKEGWV